MKRRSAPNPPQPVASAAPLAWERIGRGILFVHLLVAPLAFSQANVEGFEFVKYLVLVLTALLLLVAGALALPRITRDDLKRELRQPLVLAGLAFVVSALLSTAFSISPSTSLYGHYEDFEGLTTLLCYFVLFLAARWLVRTPEQMRAMFIAVALAAGLTTIYGILQAFHIDPFHWTKYSLVGDWHRPFATFGASNSLGAYLVLALPLMVWLAAGRSRLIQAAVGLLITAMIALTVLTLSRGAWLGMAGAACVGAIGWRHMKGTRSLRRPMAGGLLAIIGFVAVAILLPQVAARAEHFFNSSGRLGIWTCSWRMFADRPLTGWGPDTFPQAFGRYGGVGHWSSFWGESPGRAHNELLHILATQGIFGGLAALAGLFALGRTFARAWINYPQRRGLVVAIGASLAGYLIAEMFGFVVIACGSLAMVLASIASRLGETLEDTRKIAKGKASQLGFSFFLFRFAVVAGCAFLAVHLVVSPWQADTSSLEGAVVAVSHPEEGLRLHEEAVRLCPREPVYWDRFAQQCEAMARSAKAADVRIAFLERARAGYAEALALDREDGLYFDGLGRALGELARLGRAKPEEAYAAFDAALRLEPGNAYIYIDAGRAALCLADAERAKQYTDAGLRLYPDRGPLLQQVAMRWLLLNRPLDAIPAFATALKGDWRTREPEEYEMVAIYREVVRRVEIMKSHAGEGNPAGKSSDAGKGL